MNCTSVILEVGAIGDTDIIHVDADCCPQRLMFENDVLIDVVHHGLERRWQIGESKIHDCRFKKSVSGFKRRFLLVSFMDTYVIVPPSHVEFGVDVCVT